MTAIAAILVAATAAGTAAGAPADDPYLWLEDVYGAKPLAWVAAENDVTTASFEKDAHYPALFADALKIAEATDRIPVPELIGGQVYNFWQDAAHVRGIWRTTTVANYRNAAPQWRTVLDLDALATADKANWVWKGATCEPVAERRCLIELSDGGEDAVTLREFDLATGAFVSGGFALPKGKQNVGWEDADTLLVARDWGPGSMTTSGYPFVVKRLKRGAALADATEVFCGQASDVLAAPVTLADAAGHRVTGVERAVTFFESELHLLGPKGLTRVALPPKYQVAGLVGGKLIVRIDSNWSRDGKPIAPTGSIVAIDAKAAASGAALTPELLFAPGPRQSVEAVTIAGTTVLATIYDNVRGRALAFTHAPSGWTATPLTLPDNASVSIYTSATRDGTALIGIESFLAPTTVWLADAAKASATQIKALSPRFDTAGLVTEQFEATSKDGTKIPYFITHRRDIALDGSTPTIMTAYGGFQVSRTPAYSGIAGKLWLERGGAYVLANIRGGGEFGPAWHEAGLKTKRQIIYDDFAAVGEDLIARKLTSPRRLGITGGSNGGLLMGVEMIQRPDLWRAVNINVPLLDMLRMEQIAAGASWVGEYGSVTVPAERAFWEKTSPYNTLRAGAKYPVPYIFTTTKDDRVGPVHARKFAARMKEFGLPYYYYENTEGGHGSGANLKQIARTNALAYTYFTRMLVGDDAAGK